MGRLRVSVLCSALLLALFASTQLCMCGPEELVVGKESEKRGGGGSSSSEPAASSFFKGWGDWAQGKIGSYGNKAGETTVNQQKAPAGWSDWAYEKISSFSGRASKSVGDTTQAGKEKLKAEGEGAAKEGQDMWEGAKGSAKESSQKAKEYAGKAKEDIHHQAGKTYEAGKDLGSQATHKMKREAEL